MSTAIHPEPEAVYDAKRALAQVYALRWLSAVQRWSLAQEKQATGANHVCQ